MKYARRLARYILTHLVWKPYDRTKCLCGGGICEGTLDKPSKQYACKGCDRLVLWCFGASDDMPLHCDDCWNLQHLAPIPGVA